MNHSAEDASAAGALEWRATLLERVASELQNTGQKLVNFQHDLSSILEQAQVSAELVQRIQVLDETTQILDDLSRAVRVAADHHPAGEGVGRRDLEELVVLGDLRHRLIGVVCPPQADEQKRNGDVSFF